MRLKAPFIKFHGCEQNTKPVPILFIGDIPSGNAHADGRYTDELHCSSRSAQHRHTLKLSLKWVAQQTSLEVSRRTASGYSTYTTADVPPQVEVGDGHPGGEQTWRSGCSRISNPGGVKKPGECGSYTEQ